MKATTFVSILILIGIFVFGLIAGAAMNTRHTEDEELIAEVQSAMVESISHRPYVILELSDIVKDGEAAVPYLNAGWEIIAMLGNPKDKNLIMILRNPELPK